MTVSQAAEPNAARPASPLKAAIVGGLLGVLVLVGPARAQWSELRVAGGKESLWVLFDERGTKGLETRVWMRQPDRGFQSPREGARQPISVSAIAASGAYLHVFHAGGAHYRIGPRRMSPRLILPGRNVPLYLATDAAGETLYAIAPHARPPDLLSTTTSAVSRPGAATSRPSVLGGPAPRRTAWSLYRHLRSAWTSVSVLPAWFAPEDRHWMCADQGEVHLFGLRGGPDMPVWYRRWSSDQWGPPETIPLPPQANPAAAMVINTYLVLITRVPADQAGSSPKLLVLRRVQDRWESAELRTPNGKPIEMPPDRLGVATFNEKIALVGALGEGDELQAGLWSLAGGPPEEPPKALPAWQDETTSPFVPELPELAVFAVLAAVIALTFWRRQDSLMREIPLPPALELASIWRRLAAFLVDVSPAVAVVTAIATLFFGFSPLGWDVQGEDLTEAQQAGIRAAFLWGWLVIRVIYVIYCGLTEYLWGATPGKRLLQCQVVSHDLTRPRPKQIAIRNALKLLELQPNVFPLLVFVVLTRNHQRLGDLLAGTIVVQPATPAEEE